MAPTPPIRTLFSAVDIAFLLHHCPDLEKQSDIRLTCAVRHGTQILELARGLQPDILLMDSDANGHHLTSLLEAIRVTCTHTKVILFFDGDPEAAIAEALEHGLKGCLLKNCSPADCVRAVRAVQGGDLWVGRKALAQLLENLRARVQTAPGGAANHIAGLTLRESEVVLKIKLGLTNKEAARQLGISETTVKTHLQHVFHKLHISRRVELWGGVPGSGYQV